MASQNPSPERQLDEIEGAKSRYTLIVQLARREQLTVRQLIGRLGGGHGHRTFTGTPVQVADRPGTSTRTPGRCSWPRSVRRSDGHAEG